MSKAHVAVIEDDLVFQSMLNEYLSQHGYDVRCAGAGKQGLELCEQQCPDVVLCDLNLPDINGLEVIEKLLKVCAHLPIIVISASEKMSDIREAVRLGAWDYLVKPLQRLEVLDSAIGHCLERHELETSYLHDIWELDAHIDVIYQDDMIAGKLTEELLPRSPLRVGTYSFSCVTDSADTTPAWVDYRSLGNGKVLVVMAAAQNATEQSLVPLLVLKTLVDPVIRQYLSGMDNTLVLPGSLLEHLNIELCHSQVRTAFDILAGVLDTETGQWQWAQAGSKLEPSPSAKPDLALGIWKHANYRTHQLESLHRLHCRSYGKELIVSAEPQIA
ncbi:response regulator [uncultured Idiomarina sp.]|uniref:response regulator n=1 Tax=uncultured Idiomarina sp. TaxID=352961 RepID=UPI002597BB1B|nr:response regulator [uncultured Idiomarina sp.]